MRRQRQADGVGRPINELTKPRMVQWEGESRGDLKWRSQISGSISEDREIAIGPNAGSTVQGATCASGGGMGCSE